MISLGSGSVTSLGSGPWSHVMMSSGSGSWSSGSGSWSCDWSCGWSGAGSYDRSCDRSGGG